MTIFRSAILLVALLSQNAFTSEESCTTLETDFVPFSSSYLPKWIGPLTELTPRYSMLLSTHRFNKTPYLGNSSESEKSLFNTSSTLRRLDLATKEVLGKSTSYESDFRKNELDRMAKFWEGHCNRWTAAAQDKQLNKFLNEYKGLNCNGTIITRGEIEEIYTSSYLFFPQGFIGTKITRERSQLELSVASLLGIDDLAAHRMDSLITESLKRNRALGFDRDPLLQVWNHPIYKSKRCKRKVSKEKVIDFTPIKYLVSGNTKVEDLLRRLEKLDTLFFDLINESSLKVSNHNIHDQLSTDYREIAEELKQAAKMRLHNSSNLIFNITDIKISMRKLFKEGLILLKEGHEVLRIENRVGYKIEDYYGLDERLEGNSEKLTKYKTYKYALIKYDGKVIDSKWITPTDERPDYMSSAKPGTIKLPIVKDLEELIGSCNEIL